MQGKEGFEVRSSRSPSLRGLLLPLSLRFPALWQCTGVGWAGLPRRLWGGRGRGPKPRPVPGCPGRWSPGIESLTWRGPAFRLELTPASQALLVLQRSVAVHGICVRIGEHGPEWRHHNYTLPTPETLTGLLCSTEASVWKPQDREGRSPAPKGRACARPRAPQVPARKQGGACPAQTEGRGSTGSSRVGAARGAQAWGDTEEGPRSAAGHNRGWGPLSLKTRGPLENFQC